LLKWIIFDKVTEVLNYRKQIILPQNLNLVFRRVGTKINTWVYLVDQTCHLVGQSYHFELLCQKKAAQSKKSVPNGLDGHGSQITVMTVGLFGGPDLPFGGPDLPFRISMSKKGSTEQEISTQQAGWAWQSDNSDDSGFIWWTRCTIWWTRPTISNYYVKKMQHRARNQYTAGWMGMTIR